MTDPDWFTRFSTQAARWAGHPIVFMSALGAVVLWAISGPFAGFSETWQLIINTGTTIVTFLMVFLIQNTQNRDTTAMQIKLDELIRTTRGAQNALLDLEKLSDEQLEEFRKQYERLASEARRRGGRENAPQAKD